MTRGARRPGRRARANASTREQRARALPPTRIAVLESRRRLERRLRRAAQGRPVEIRAARTIAELIQRLAGAPLPIALIEHVDDFERTLAAAAAAGAAADAVFVAAATDLPEVQDAALRLAGVGGVLRPPIDDAVWRAVLRLWVVRSQRRIILGDPSPYERALDRSTSP